MKIKRTVSRVVPVMGMTALILSGCVNNTRVDELEQELTSQRQENKTLRSDIVNLQQDNAAKASALDNIQSAKADNMLLPPEAKSGECYARVWVPATYKNVAKQVLVKEASERVEVVPAKYDWGTETVLVKEASSRLEKVPAVYGTEQEKILVREAQRVWKTDLAKDAAPASDELLTAARNHGIDLDGATPGMCFHEHYHPAEYITETKKVLVSDADAALAVNDAQYRWVEKRVMVKEPSFRMEEVPAQYEWVEEKVVDEPAHTIWKKGEGPIQKIDEATGEIMCLVEVPATYKTLRKRVEKSAATTRRIEIPAEYKTVKVRELVADATESKRDIPATYKTVEITKKVSDNEFIWHEVHDKSESRHTRTGNKICLTESPAQYKTVTRKVVKTPAAVHKVEIPAETKTIKVRKMVSEPQEKRFAVPAEYKTVTERQLDKEGFMEWRSILCKTNMTGSRITQIQEALKREGFNPGPIDGVVGEETIAAVNAFQKAKGLPVDRYLNIQTLDALGVAAK